MLFRHITKDPQRAHFCGISCTLRASAWATDILEQVYGGPTNLTTGSSQTLNGLYPRPRNSATCLRSWRMHSTPRKLPGICHNLHLANTTKHNRRPSLLLHSPVVVVVIAVLSYRLCNSRTPYSLWVLVCYEYYQILIGSLFFPFIFPDGSS